MEEIKKDDNNGLKRKHFAKLHEKIQNKYVEMQKKIHRSRSIESFTSTSDDYVIKYSKNSDSETKEVNEVFEETQSDCKSDSKSETNVVKHQIIIEDVNKQNADFQECVEKDVFDSEVTLVEQNIRDREVYFGDDFNSNFESIHESSTESVTIEEITPPTPTTPSPKISIREKIGARISAVKERRREVKDKKRESLEKLLILSNTTKHDNLKKKTKIATVTVGLIEATGSENDLALEDKLFCRIRLGSEKRKSKSKSVKNEIVRYTFRKRVVTWQELYNFSLLNDPENSILEITICDKDKGDNVGRCTVDLTTLEQEETHRMRLNVEKEGDTDLSIFILLTITGTNQHAELMNSFVDLKEYAEGQRKLDKMKRNYWYQITSGMREVGWLSVMVHGAKGLAYYNCCCVVQHGNDRLQTETLPKTNCPTWTKIFSFKLRDITTILYVMVYDQSCGEFAGEVWIPLVKIESGKKKWYALKDQRLRGRAPGDNPRILLEISLHYNIIKAAIATVQSREKLYLDKESDFSRQILAENIARIKFFIDWLLDAAKIFTMCFEWDSKLVNIISVVIWVVFWYYCQPWWFPLMGLIPFIWYTPTNERFSNFRTSILKAIEIKRPADQPVEVQAGLISRLYSLSELLKHVQNGIGDVASAMERIKNLLNCSVPIISGMIMFVILLLAFIVYLVPPRYMIILWGVQKFIKKLIKPHRVPTNEVVEAVKKVPDNLDLALGRDKLPPCKVVDFLLRIPDEETLIYCKELPLLPLPPEDEL